MLEHYLIAHCSPTLAGLKTAGQRMVPQGTTRGPAVDSNSNLRLCQLGFRCLDQVGKSLRIVDGDIRQNFAV